MNGNGSNHNNGHHRRGGPKTPEGRARSLANLKPAKPGEIRNPAGRPSAGASVREWWNQMQGWDRERLVAVVADESAPVSKVAAARAWLAACQAGAELDRILDQTVGKPAQSVDLTSNGETVLLPLKLDGDREL